MPAPPPAVEVLPDAQTARAFFQDVCDTDRRDGVELAQRLFAGGTGMDEDNLPLEDLRPEFRELMERMDANAGNFFAHRLLPFTRYQPDLAALKEVADKIVPAAGVASSRHLPAQPIAVLAEQLGWPVVPARAGVGGRIELTPA